MHWINSSASMRLSRCSAWSTCSYTWSSRWSRSRQGCSSLYRNRHGIGIPFFFRSKDYSGRTSVQTLLPLRYVRGTREHEKPIPPPSLKEPVDHDVVEGGVPMTNGGVNRFLEQGTTMVGEVLHNAGAPRTHRPCGACRGHSAAVLVGADFGPASSCTAASHPCCDGAWCLRPSVATHAARENVCWAVSPCDAADRSVVVVTCSRRHPARTPGSGMGWGRENQMGWFARS